MRLYLDACCLNRPFDDQGQDRIRLESEAVRLILARVTSGELEWIGSDALDREIGKTPSGERWLQLVALLSATTEQVRISPKIAARAAELTKFGIHAADAVHVACAEVGSADAMLTTDDRLVRLCRKLAADLHVQVENPLQWLVKETEDGNKDHDAR